MSGAPLPQELVDELVDYFIDDYPQLRYFLATCTSFANRARYHIYRAIRIVTLCNLTGFLELCQAVPEIPLLVRALTIDPTISSDQRGTIQLFDVLKSLASLNVVSYDVRQIQDYKIIAIARGLPLTTLVFERAYLRFPRVDEFVSLIRGNAHLKTLCLGHIRVLDLVLDPFTRFRRPNPEQRIEALCLLTASALSLVLGYAMHHSDRLMPDPDANYTLIAMESVQRLVLSFDTLHSTRLLILFGLASNLRELIITELYPLDPYAYVTYGFQDLDLSRFSIIKAEVSDPRFGWRLVEWLVSCLVLEDQPSASTNAPEITIVVTVKEDLRLAWLNSEWNTLWCTLDINWAALSSPPTITIIITNGDHMSDISACGSPLKQVIEAACPHLVSRARLNIRVVKREQCDESFLYRQERLREH
ncbi:hypothetical protein BDZ89DRAFT_647269 [Hymenopellis radicata]|nr:hypothetical protein BDZ89DRAFT_647269 [Hymenopellis radicata]